MDLGPQLDWRSGHNGCTYNPDPTRSPVGDCGQMAAFHIRLRDDHGMVAACTDHLAFALANLPILDWHAWMAWCNMPGALWHPSPTPDEADSWCSLDDGTEGLTLSGSADVPAAQPIGSRS